MEAPNEQETFKWQLEWVLWMNLELYILASDPMLLSAIVQSLNSLIKGRCTDLISFG